MYSTAMRYAATPNMDTIHSTRVNTLLPPDRNMRSISPTVTASSVHIPLRMRRWLARCSAPTSSSRRSYNS